MLPEGLYGSSLGGHVKVSAMLEPAARFQTLAHELAHERLHSSRAGFEERPSKAIRELEAEAIAYVVCMASGVECRDASCDYIQMYDGNETLLAASLERIRATAIEILDLMDSERNSLIDREVNHAA
jgi:antirestriction protein ArdC